MSWGLHSRAYHLPHALVPPWPEDVVPWYHPTSFFPPPYREGWFLTMVIRLWLRPVLCCPYLVGGMDGFVPFFSFLVHVETILVFFCLGSLLGNGILLLLLCIYFGWIEKARRGMYVCLISEGSSRLYMILMRAKSRTGTCELMWKNASKESQLIWLVMDSQLKKGGLKVEINPPLWQQPTNRPGILDTYTRPFVAETKHNTTCLFYSNWILTIIIIYATPDGHAHERKQIFVTAEDF